MGNFLRIILIGLMAGVVVLSGCSSSKSANKENFKKAITAWAKDYAGYYNDTKDFPVKIGLMEEHPNRNLFQRMAKVGVLNAKQTHPGMGVFYLNGVLQNATIYSVSEQGAQYYSQGKGLKAANLEVLEVLQFTEPATDSTGSKASTVKYKCKVIPGDLMKLINSDAKEETVEYDIKLVLTNDGWKVWM